MKKTKEVFIDGEVVYIREDFLGWHVTHPIKIDGKINWKNLIAGGSWIKFFLIIIFVILALGAIFEVRSIIQIANECLLANQPIQINPEILLNPIP